MAWNSEPTVRDLGKYADKHNFKQAIIVGIKSGGKFQVVSYGKNAELCKGAKQIADQIYNDIASGDIEVEE
jgi:hypothetical protein